MNKIREQEDAINKKTKASKDSQACRFSYFPVDTHEQEGAKFDREQIDGTTRKIDGTNREKLISEM